MTKVGFVTTPLASGHAVRGIGFYVKRLLPELKKQAPHFDIEIVEDLKNCGLVHYPWFDLFWHTLPVFRKQRTVVTIHDVIPLEFPMHYPPGVRGWMRLQLQRLAIQSVSIIITDSQASAVAIEKYLPVPKNKIHVVYLAAGEEFKKIVDTKLLAQVRAKYELPDKFVLYVGDVNWNKNVPSLAAACQQIRLPLAIVGRQAAEIEKLDLSHPELRHLANLDLGSVLRLGFVPDADLVAIYNLATVYCQPSFAEGFGLPILEAMACGTAVACSRTHSLPEIAGKAAVYFNPYNVDDMAQAILKAKPGEGIAQAKKFSWEATARQTLEVYQQVI